MMFFKRKEKKKAGRESMADDEAKDLVCLGIKVRLAQSALASGLQNCSYEGVVIFEAVPLSVQEDYVCDAVAVALPPSAGNAYRVIDRDEDMSAGLFVHLGTGGRYMSWVHIDNLTQEDLMRIAAAARKTS